MRYCIQYKNTLIVVVLFLFIFLHSNAQTLRILPFGNSITEGTDGDPPQESLRIAYRYTLYSLLNAAGYNFDFVGHGWSGYEIFPDADHCGIPGTRDQYLVRLLQDGYDERWGVQITPGNQPYLDVYPADIILLHIGTNDITHDEGTSPNSVSQILDEIDAWEVRTGNEVIVFVARILNRKVYNLTTTQFNNNVAAMVAARDDPNIMMVDIENGAGIDYSTDMQDDGIHPYESGYTKMGQKWFEAIQSLNKPPYFTSTGITTATEDILYSYSVTVDDDNPLDNLTIIAGSKPAWCTFTDNGDKTGLLSGTPGNDDVGPHPVSLIVSDGKVIATQNFTINVSNENDPPQITGQNYIETDEDTPYTFRNEDFTIVDIDNPPSELKIICLSGEDYGYQDSTVIPDQDFFGTLIVNLTVTDQIDTSDIFQAVLNVNPVNDPPVITGQKRSIEVKQYTSLEISTYDIYYEDIDNNVADLSVVILPHPDTLYTFAGNQLMFIKDTLGLVDVPVLLDDGEDTSNEYELQINVMPQYSPPEFTSDPPLEATVGKVYFYIVTATDPDEGDELTYSASSLPDWLEFNSDLKLLGGNPSAQDTGWVWVGIDVTDGIHVVEQLYQVEVKLSTNTEIHDAMGTGLIQSLYPVPAKETIFLSLAAGDQYTVQIFSTSGILMASYPSNSFDGSLIQVDLEGYSPGIYYLRVMDGSRSDTRKFVIRK